MVRVPLETGATKIKNGLELESTAQYRHRNESEKEKEWGHIFRPQNQTNGMKEDQQQSNSTATTAATTTTTSVAYSSALKNHNKLECTCTLDGR